MQHKFHPKGVDLISRRLTTALRRVSARLTFRADTKKSNDAKLGASRDWGKLSRRWPRLRIAYRSGQLPPGRNAHPPYIPSASL